MIPLWKLKGMFWRTYYYFFTDRFEDFDSLKELLNSPYQKY